MRDPEVAAKHKAFLHKVNVATTGSMDTYLKASVKAGLEGEGSEPATVTEDEAMEAGAGPPLQQQAQATAAGLKRKLIITGLPGSQGGANKRRRSNRNSSSGTVSF